MAPLRPAESAAARSRRLATFLTRRGRSRESVHALHRDLRRDRFEGQILARILGASASDRSLERPPALRDLERALGRWRDVEITRELWRSVRTKVIGRREARWLAKREKRLDTESDTFEREAVELVRRHLAAHPSPAPSPRPALSPKRLQTPLRWRKELAVRRKRYLKSLAGVTDSLPAEATHAFRQEVRRLGVYYDLLAIAPWAAPPRRSEKIQRVLDRLGRLHDWDRAIARLRQEPSSGLREEYRDRLRSERRRTTVRARRVLASKGVRRYAEKEIQR